MTVPSWLSSADRMSPWGELHACVAGLGISGLPAARALLDFGARVTVVDEGAGERQRAAAASLEKLGATVRLGTGATASVPDGVGLVVTSPGWVPGSPLFRSAEAAGVPVWGDVELAWRLRDPERPVPWLAVTGTNGKTTTTRMTTEILRAAGYRATWAGNIGDSIIEAVLDPEPYDVIAVELSSFQLHYTHSLAVHSAALLNFDADHVDWHGSMEAYAADKRKLFRSVQATVVRNLDDPATDQVIRGPEDLPDGIRTVGFTLGAPSSGALGLVDDHLIDRAFVDDPRDALELGLASDVKPYARHNLANALAAAALARSFGVPPQAVAAGLANFRPAPHRIAHVADVAGVAYVDDSKATNAHAARASLAAFDSIVWIAGGLAKGTTFDELVRGCRDRLQAVVLIGTERYVIAEALARHAPEIPVIEVSDTDTGAMDRAVAEAARVAKPGDTVLLAPACASWDMFESYAARGEAFAAAVHRLAGG